MANFLKSSDRERAMRVIVSVGLMLASGLACAQYRCTDSAGKLSIQQFPCAPADRQQAVQLKSPARSGSEPTSQLAGSQSKERSVLRRFELDRRVRELEQDIRLLTDGISQRNASMDAELDRLKAQKSSANNNLAGATYMQSLSAEMQAVAAKHDAVNKLDVERLRQLKVDLEAAQKAAAAQL